MDLTFMKCIVILSVFVLCVFFFINYIAKSRKVSINVVDELRKDIMNRSGLKTKVIIKKCSPCYNIEDDIIEINEENNIRTLAEGYHEWGHAIYNRRFVGSDVTFCGPVISFIYKYIAVFAICSTLVTSIIEKYYLVSLLLCMLELWLITNDLKEEISSSITGYYHLKNKPFLNKIDIMLVKLSLFSALLTYILIFVITIILILVNLGFFV